MFGLGDRFIRLIVGNQATCALLLDVNIAVDYEDTYTTPLGATDLEAWHRKQKRITERRLREEEEKREPAKNWMCLQYIYWGIRGEKYMPEIPAHLRMEMARCMLPDIIAFCESEKGKAEIAQWKAEQEAKKEKGEVA